MLLETHSMTVLVNVDGLFSGHYLLDGRIAFLLVTLLCGSQYPGHMLERKTVRYCHVLVFKLLFENQADVF